jgi:hypothetical protein
VDLVGAISQDKDAEITANSVISMLHLTVDDRTTEQLIRLQALPKICSLVGAASANVAVQRRAMYTLCTVGAMCSAMSDAEYGLCYVPQVVLPLLIAMLDDHRDWIVRREALRCIAVYCLRRDSAHHIVRLNGVEKLLECIHRTVAAVILHETNGIDSVSTLGDAMDKNNGGDSDVAEETPTYELATVVEQLAIKALGMLLIYEELVPEVRRRTKMDSRFVSLENIFGDRIGHVWDISELMRAKRRGEGSNSSSKSNSKRRSHSPNISNPPMDPPTHVPVSWVWCNPKPPSMQCRQPHRQPQQHGYEQ